MTQADLVVIGSVLAIKPTAFSGTITTLAVDQTLKGPSASTVVVT